MSQAKIRKMAQEDAASKERKIESQESEDDSEEENEAKFKAYCVEESKQRIKDRFNQEMEEERNSAIAQGLNPNDKGMQTEERLASGIYLPHYRAFGIACTCYKMRMSRVRKSLAPLSNWFPESLKNQATEDYFKSRDKCYACKPMEGRSAEKCSCHEAEKYFKKTLPPYDRPVFPTQEEMFGAELDWHYEPSRCLYFRAHGARPKEEKPPGYAYEMKNIRHVDQWTWWDGAPIRFSEMMWDKGEDHSCK